MRIFLKLNKRFNETLGFPIGYLVDGVPRNSSFKIYPNITYELKLLKFEWRSGEFSENLMIRDIKDSTSTPLFLSTDTLEGNIGADKLLIDVTKEYVRDRKINSIIS